VRSDNKTGVCGVRWSALIGRYAGTVMVAGKRLTRTFLTLEAATEGVKQMRTELMTHTNEARVEVAEAAVRTARTAPST